MIQRAFKKHFSAQRLLREKQAACDLLTGQKERRKNSVHRAMYGDYLGVPNKPGLMSLISRRDKVKDKEIY